MERVSAVERCFASCKLILLWKDDQFAQKQLSMFGRTDLFHLRTERSGQVVLTNGSENKKIAEPTPYQAALLWNWYGTGRMIKQAQKCGPPWQTELRCYVLVRRIARMIPQDPTILEHTRRPFHTSCHSVPSPQEWNIGSWHFQVLHLCCPRWSTWNCSLCWKGWARWIACMDIWLNVTQCEIWTFRMKTVQLNCSKISLLFLVLISKLVFEHEGNISQYWLWNNRWRLQLIRAKQLIAGQGPVSRKSRNFSSDMTLFITSKWRSSETRNIAVF